MILFSLIGVALMLGAAPVDASMVAGDDPTSWHGWVHGLMFLLLVPTSVLGPSQLPRWGAPTWRPAAAVSAIVSVLVAGALLSDQGKLAFDFTLRVLLGWVASVASRAARLSL